jgi:hypothetical protein
MRYHLIFLLLLIYLITRGHIHILLFFTPRYSWNIGVKHQLINQSILLFLPFTTMNENGSAAQLLYIYFSIFR